jgi:hypothetical protein
MAINCSSVIHVGVDPVPEKCHARVNASKIRIRTAFKNSQKKKKIKTLH